MEQPKVPWDSPADLPRYRSRFGGLWTDRLDAHEVLDQRVAEGVYDEVEAERLSYYIDHGYVILPGATDPALIDEYLELFERIWQDPPAGVWAISGGQSGPLRPELYDKVAKVSKVHLYFEKAGDLIFPPAVLRFLLDIFERPPVAFQSMTMRKGSEEPLHIDTGPLTLTEPMTLCASWVALEDVQPDSGEFQFTPGTHLVPEMLHHGATKGHNGDMTEYGGILKRIQEESDVRGLKTERFMAKKGDVLIWHADLMHGGAPIADPSLTRKSLVAHFMPLGVMPTFYDFSEEREYAYPNGGHCLDNPDLRQRQANESRTSSTPAIANGSEKAGSAAVGAPSENAAASGRTNVSSAPSGTNGHSTLERIKGHVPLSMRTFVRRQLDWLASNPQLAGRDSSASRQGSKPGSGGAAR